VCQACESLQRGFIADVAAAIEAEGHSQIH
jgi:hypothetical protein